MAFWRQPAIFAWRGKRLRPPLLAVAVMAIACRPPASYGQDLRLRGTVDMAAVTGSLLPNETLAGRASAPGDPQPLPSTQSGIAGQRYQPASPGAVTEETEDAPSAFADRQRLTLSADNAASTQEAEMAPALRAWPDDITADELVLRTGPENLRTPAISGGPLQSDDDPYAPLGLRLGSFDVYGAFDQGTMWTSNVSSSPDGGEGVVSETALRLTAVSDWSRHAARLEAQGQLRESISGAPLSEFRGDVRAALELDLASDLGARAVLGYAVRPESAASPVEIAGTVSQPTTHTFSGEIGLEKRAGRYRFDVAGSVEREVYSDAELSTGATVSQEDRNYTLALLALRTGYEVSPTLVPFVEAEIGRRFYDQATDASGYARSGDQFGFAAGLEWDRGEKLRGELSAGWVEERFDDERLQPISGPSVSAAVDWSPERGTTVRLTGETIVEGTTTPGESGSIQYSGLVEARRQVRANLIAEAGLGAAWRDYSDSSDHDLQWLARIGSTWWMNRYAGLEGRLEHERFTSTQPGRDYEVSSVYLGLKLQR